MADYECFALWDQDNIKNLNPDDLPISKALKSRIHEWEQMFDATLDRKDPASSGFLSEEELHRFDEEGRNLWRQLNQELGENYRVCYYSLITEEERVCNLNCVPAL